MNPTHRDRRAKSAWQLTLATLVLVPLCLVAWKVLVMGYSLTEILPRHRYDTTIELRLDGHDSSAQLRTFLPQSDERQTIAESGASSGPSLQLTVENDALNRRASWSGESVPDGTVVTYSFSVLSNSQAYRISPDLVVPTFYPSALSAYLAPEEAVQVDDPEIVAALHDIGADQGTVLERLQRIYDRTSALTQRPFKGTTDALTALRLGEASCNGKSRLFVALSRAAGIPARLVGGLILNPGSKKTSHQWVEAYIGGHWVPFEPTNHHFASIPENYLVLYRGDEALFSHTKEVNFDYRFEVGTVMVPSPSAMSAFGAFNLWALFDRLGLPFSLLRTLLMLPAGALIVVLFRNVVGLKTFGTFLPALIAAAAGSSGIAWGLLSVIIVIGAVSMVRWGVQRLRLLHSPTLAILLAAVAASMLLSSLAAERLGLLSLARVSFFPIAVMAIAAERFYLALAEQGTREALSQLGGTLLVVVVCSVVMNSLALQILLSGFPEILLLVVAANVYLGRWVGIRVLEVVRFRPALGVLP